VMINNFGITCSNIYVLTQCKVGGNNAHFFLTTLAGIYFEILNFVLVELT